MPLVDEIGSPGNDTLAGAPGDDSISAGGGDDLIFASAGNDWIDGGPGTDTLNFGDFRAEATTYVWDANGGVVTYNILNAAGAQVGLTNVSNVEAIVGSPFDDRLEAVRGTSSVFGGAGDDQIVVIDESAQPEYLRGGEGNDSIGGGDGPDDINGNQGNDTVHGWDGNDWVLGGQGNDMVFGDGGDDIVLGNLGDDTLDGGAGNDIIRGGQGDDVLTGGPGADWLSGDRGNDTLTGGPGADTFHTFAGAGLDLVTDFNAAEGDRVQLDPGTAYLVKQVGADTVIDMGNGDEMVLQNVQMSSLPPGWIYGA